MTSASAPAGPAQLRVEDLPGGVRQLTLSNPAKRNALDGALVRALARAVDPSSTAHVRAFLLRGEGERAFCSGYDISQLSPGARELPDDELLRTLELLASHPAPSVALVLGGAFGGGCDLACACDFRIGGADPVFCMPPSRLGLVYAAEGLARVASVVGLSRAKLMFLSGRRIEAPQALCWGLLESLWPTPKAATEAAMALCQELADGAPLAVGGMKRAFSWLGRACLSPEELQTYRGLRHQAYQSEDAREGVLAFAQKRPPKFRGR